MQNKFHWWEFDINSFLPKNWDLEITKYVNKNAKKIKLNPTNSITSRESIEIKNLDSLIVDGNQIREDFPWLFNLYESLFLQYAEKTFNTKVLLSKNDIYALNFNIQKGLKMRYECHIDSNPIQGVFYITTHKKGMGGELIVSENSEAIGVNEINKDCKIIYPKSGYLYLFPGQLFPHYVKPLNDKNSIRIAMPMNFYTINNSEDERPKDLNKHLFKKEID